MRRKKKTIECIEYLSVSAPLDKVDRLEDKQSKYIHEYVKNKEYMIVGTERRHGFSQNDVDRQWHQIVDKIRKKQVDGVIVANMSVITDNLIDAFIKVAQDGIRGIGDETKWIIEQRKQIIRDLSDIQRVQRCTR